MLSDRQPLRRHRYTYSVLNLLPTSMGFGPQARCTDNYISFALWGRDGGWARRVQPEIDGDEAVSIDASNNGQDDHLASWKNHIAHQRGPHTICYYVVPGKFESTSVSADEARA